MPGIALLVAFNNSNRYCGYSTTHRYSTASPVAQCCKGTQGRCLALDEGHGWPVSCAEWCEKSTSGY